MAVAGTEIGLHLEQTFSPEAQAVLEEYKFQQHCEETASRLNELKRKISGTLITSHDEVKALSAGISPRSQSAKTRVFRNTVVGFEREKEEDLATACNNTLLRKRKLLVKNINALSGIDEQKLKQMQKDQDRHKRLNRPKKVRIMKLHEMFKRGVGNPIQLILSELIAEREYLNQLEINPKLELDTLQHEIAEALAVSSNRTEFEMLNPEIQDFIQRKFEEEHQRTELPPSQTQLVDHHRLLLIHSSFKMPADLLALYEEKQDCVTQEDKEEMITFLLDTFPEIISGFEKGGYDFFVARDEAPAQDDLFFLLFACGSDVPVSHCCRMPVSFKFSRKLGFKAYCMEPLCNLNPLKHEALPEQLRALLFSNQPLPLRNMALNPTAPPLPEQAQHFVGSSSAMSLPRPPSQRYMAVARSLRGGRHKGGSLRSALDKDQTLQKVETQRSLVRLSERAGRREPEIEKTVENWTKTGGQMLFPNQFAAVGTVLGYTKDEMESIESQLWGKKTASLNSRKALTKLTNSSGKLNVRIHPNVRENTKEARKRPKGLNDSAINKILFNVSNSKNFF